MLRLVIHTVDEKQPLSPDVSVTEWNPSFDINPNFVQLKGVLHLFRTISPHPPIHHHATTSSSPKANPNPNSISTVSPASAAAEDGDDDANSLLIVAVPSYLSSFELIRFFGYYVDYMRRLLLIK